MVTSNQLYWIVCGLLLLIFNIFYTKLKSTVKKIYYRYFTLNKELKNLPSIPDNTWELDNIYKYHLYVLAWRSLKAANINIYYNNDEVFGAILSYNNANKLVDPCLPTDTGIDAVNMALLYHANRHKYKLRYVIE